MKKPHSERVQRMLTRYGSFLYRARRGVLLVWLLLLVGAGVFGVGVFGRLQGTGAVDPNSQSSRAEQLLNTRLNGTYTDVVILLQSSTLRATDPAFAQEENDLLTKLRQGSEVTTLTSYYSWHGQNFISKDGHETFITMQLAGKDFTSKQNEYQALQPLLTEPDLQIGTTGNVPITMAFNQQIGQDLGIAEAFTFPILAVLLLLVFSGVVAAGLPLLIGCVAILGALAILDALTLFTNIASYVINIVIMLGLGLAIDYSLFLVTRFREELVLNGNHVRSALEKTMATAGRTVIFSALTVGSSLSSLLLFPLPFLSSVGYGAVASILVVLLASLTLLPALLALLGTRVNALSLQRLFRRSTRTRTEQRGGWYRLSEAVMRWPVPTALVVLAFLLTLGWPFLHIRFATLNIDSLPAGQPTRVVSDKLGRDFAHQQGAQLTIAVTTPGDALSPNNLTSLDSYVKQIEAMKGVEAVQSLVTVNPNLTLSQYEQFYANPSINHQLTTYARQMANGNFTRITVALQPAEQSSAAVNIVNAIRAIHAPGGLVALVDGSTPILMDLLSSMDMALPYAFAVIIVAIFVLLFLMTGSLVMPLKAILLNVLSLSATFGGLVWIFQDGHLQNLLNFPTVGGIDSSEPVLIFAIAFGLSMDYEVFLLSRIKEHFDRTGDNRKAISTGLQQTGWLITSAAVLFAVVVGAFGTSKIISLQEIGVGLTIAVIMDATLVRMLLVPATLRLLGKFNWWAPAPLHRLWQRIGFTEAANESMETSEGTQSVPAEHSAKIEV
jgi:trehalose monomycolate/heme transporter